MTHALSTPSQLAPVVHRIIRDAIADPGKLAGRNFLDDESSRQAGAVVLALAAHGYKIVPAAELERLEEAASVRQRRFPNCIVIKTSPDADFYVGWSFLVSGPVISGTREQMLAAHCPESMLRRADETGTSAEHPEDGYGWDSDGFFTSQGGWLPRQHLAAYATAIAEGRKTDALTLLRPYGDETAGQTQSADGGAL